MSRMLLLSNSTNHGCGFLDHCVTQLQEVLGPVRRVWFVPYALYDRDAYSARVQNRLQPLGYEVSSVHAAADPAAAARGAEAVFVGGGNTFRLLDWMQRLGLIDAIRSAVEGGAVYIGSSAGTNVACPTIKTTNDMPIVQPADFRALGLVPFNINPHYLDPDPGSTHMGESRDTRIREFHEENDAVVVGLREGAMLRIEDGTVLLGGSRGARVFARGAEAVDYDSGARLDFLMQA